MACCYCETCYSLLFLSFILNIIFFFKLNKFPCHTGYIIILPFTLLTHWGCVMHICIGYLTIIGSDNGLLPGRRQAIIWTNAGLLLIVHLGTNFSEILIEIYTFSFKKMHLKMSSGKWRPFCLGLNVLKALFCGFLTHLWGHKDLPSSMWNSSHKDEL